jgi:hypothetical protein
MLSPAESIPRARLGKFLRPAGLSWQRICTATPGRVLHPSCPPLHIDIPVRPCRQCADSGAYLQGSAFILPGLLSCQSVVVCIRPLHTLAA